MSPKHNTGHQFGPQPSLVQNLAIQPNGPGMGQMRGTFATYVVSNAY